MGLINDACKTITVMDGERLEEYLTSAAYHLLPTTPWICTLYFWVNSNMV